MRELGRLAPEASPRIPVACPRTADIVRRWSGIPASLAGWGNSAAQLRRTGRGDEVDFVIGHLDDVRCSLVFQGREVRAEAAPVAAGRGPGGWTR